MPKSPHCKLVLRLMTIVLLLCLNGCAGRVPESGPAFKAQAWPAAEALFRKDSRWLGGDGAGSIDLGNGRVLWLFGDSLIEPKGILGRKGAGMVRNSIAVQQGYDPTQASMRFFWGGTDSAPADFFQADRPGIWLWPGHGIRLGERLLIFLMEIRLSQAEFFEPAGWRAVLITNPDQDPQDWRLVRAKTVDQGFQIMVGSAAVIRVAEHVYAYGAESVQGHPVYLARWALAAALQGDLREPEWWDGHRKTWVQNHQAGDKPPPLFTQGQMEFSVHFDPGQGAYLQVQTMSFWDPAIVVRKAEAPTGPWSAPVPVHHPKESDRKGLLVYAGKAHPELAGADLIITYAVNTFDHASVVGDEGIYYPRFVRLDWDEN